MNSRFGEAELSSNHAYAVTLPMQESNFVAIDNHSRPAKCFALLLRSSQSRRYALSDDIALQFSDCTKYGKHHFPLAVDVSMLSFRLMKSTPKD
jgi:hypothetical protein